MQLLNEGQTMATWNDLEKHIKSSYHVDPNAPAGMVGILFPVGSRSQAVFVHRTGNELLGEWATIISPIGKVSAAKLKEITTEAYDLVCGGIVMLRDLVCLSHSVPLADLDINEFTAPLVAITVSADALEQKFTGRDEH